MHGFLGPNGSGKTTTIRILLGLVAADSGSGEIRLLDQPVPDGLPDVVGSVGALVETPLFFPGFSGRLNLQLLAEAAALDLATVDGLQVFCHAERGLTKQLRRLLVTERQIPREAISISAYWALGRVEDQFQAEKREPVGRIDD